MGKVHRKRWRIRETPASDTFPKGMPEEWVEIAYSEDEYRLAAQLAGKGSVNEVDTLHELKALLGCQLLPDDPGAKPSSPFQIPESVEKQLSLGE